MSLSGVFSKLIVLYTSEYFKVTRCHTGVYHFMVQAYYLLNINIL